MYDRLTRVMTPILLAASTSIVGLAQQDSSPPPVQQISVSALRAESLKALRDGEYDTAIVSADTMVREFPEDARATRLAADIYLRAGKAETAVRLFDRYLESEPEELPSLWQRGIALYFVGDYARGAKQFEVHRTVNPQDVENAAWHFLCIAKSDSVEKAKQMVLPAPNDPRIPMAEVLEMLSSGDTDAVRQRVDRVDEASAGRADAEFYGDFYLGLYADAQGDREKALELMSRAAKDAPHHYMGDVARVYAKYLAQ